MPASFPSSVKAFTTKSDGAGNTILAAHINDIQAEITALENCLLGNTTLNAVITGTVIAGGAVTAQTTLKVTGNATSGCLAIGGDFYNHVLVSAGLNANPLTNIHQVCFYGALQGNANVDGVNGFVSAFESAIGLAAGAYTVGKMAAFAVGAFGPFGAGAAATRTWNLSCFDQTWGTNNAAIAMWDSTFTGNWFIHYEGTRASRLNGDLVLGAEVYRNIDTNFLRLAGGNAGGGGGHIALFGAAHATLANQGQLNASGGWSMIGDVSSTGNLALKTGTAIPAGGSTAVRVTLTSTAGFGVYAGSGAPTVSAAKGSLYLRSDGSSTTTRAYINTDGATTWTAITTVA